MGCHGLDHPGLGPFGFGLSWHACTNFWHISRFHNIFILLTKLLLNEIIADISGPQVQIQDDPGKSKMYDLYGIYSHSFKLDINTKDPISDHWQTNEFGVNSLTCFTYWISFCQTIGRMTLPSQKYLDVTLTKPINWTITLECNITKLTLRCRKIPRVQPWIEPWRWKYNHIPIKDNPTARLWK